MDEQQAVAVAPKSPIMMGQRGIQLSTLDDLWRFASAVAKSPFAPKGMATPEAVMVAIQYGLEVGLTPMAALQNISVVNSKPSLYGDAMLAVVLSSGLMEGVPFEDFEGAPFEDSYRAVCITKRRGAKEAKVTYFSVEDAKRAGLWNKDGPWRSYPKRMLMFRARGFNLRDNFPDALKGLISMEEAQDYPTEEPIAVRGNMVERATPESLSQDPKDHHPTAVQMQALMDLIGTCGFDVSAHLRETLKLPDGHKVTNKAAREAMTMEQYFIALDFYNAKLKADVELDVDDHSPPGATTDGEGISEVGQEDDRAATWTPGPLNDESISIWARPDEVDELGKMARQAGPKYFSDVEKLAKAHQAGRIPRSRYQEMRELVTKALQAQGVEA